MHAFPPLDPSDLVVGSQCIMSDNGSRVLWTGRKRSGAVSVRLLTRGKRHRSDEPSDGCSVGEATTSGTNRGHASHESSWNASDFRILHDRDPYLDVWGSTDVEPVADEDGDLGGGASIATTMFADGSWLVLLLNNGRLRFIATDCTSGETAAAAAPTSTTTRKGKTRRGTAWQELAPLADGAGA